MKLFTTVILLLTLNSANAATNCIEPSGQFTSKEMVLKQFVYMVGTANWGDWCQETSTSAESTQCNKELDQWDSWITCTEDSYKKSCEKWADKENFAATQKEYNEFILTCIENNHLRSSDISLVATPKVNEQCQVISSISLLATGRNKEVICRETVRALTGSSALNSNSKIQIHINTQRTYEVELNQIYLKVGEKTVYAGSGVLKWNPEGEEVILN